MKHRSMVQNLHDNELFIRLVCADVHLQRDLIIKSVCMLIFTQISYNFDVRFVITRVFNMHIVAFMFYLNLRRASSQ